jgi:geranylgeranyl pyrophosphate synthase
MNKERLEKTVEEVKYIINSMKKYGSIQYAREKANILFKAAKKIYRENIENYLLEEPKMVLEAVIQFMIDRRF